MNDVRDPDPGVDPARRDTTDAAPRIVPLAPADAIIAQAAEAASDAPPSSSGSPPAPDRYLGCTIDNRYKVEGIVGEGGMGVVYQCRHKIINKRVALKILRADLARDPEVTERFLMEAKAASAIENEHIIDISDFGQLPDGAAYFVMEFLDGTPLAQLSGSGRWMPAARIVHIGLQLTEGLAAAHRMGIVHRDLKPDNVFLITRGKETDFVKILDFGIAKVSSRARGTNRLTQAGSVFGTPHYMSPEQAAGAPLDHRGDIYALGVILYEMATGQVPFDAENFVGILSQQLYQTPVPPRERSPELNIPPGLEAVILRCLEKRPEQRYQTMHEVHADLAALAQTPSFLPVPWVPAEPGRAGDAPERTTEGLRRPRRWPLYVALTTPIAAVATFLALELASRAEAQVATAAPEAPPVLAEPEPPAAPVAAPEPEPVTSKVILAVAPTSARVFKDEVDLGSSPVVLDVAEGSPVAVEIRHPDYQPEQLVLDGKDNRVAVELKPLKKKSKSKKKRATRGTRSTRVPSKSPDKAAAKGKAPLGGELFVEPWEKR